MTDQPNLTDSHDKSAVAWRQRVRLNLLDWLAGILAALTWWRRP